MGNRFLVATTSRERDNVIHKLLEVDRSASVTKSKNPCVFYAETKVTLFTLDAIAGVAHVSHTLIKGT